MCFAERDRDGQGEDIEEDYEGDFSADELEGDEDNLVDMVDRGTGDDPSYLEGDNHYSRFKLMVTVLCVKSLQAKTFFYVGRRYHSEKEGKRSYFSEKAIDAMISNDIQTFMTMKASDIVECENWEISSALLKPIIIEEVISNTTGEIQGRFVSMETPILTVV